MPAPRCALTPLPDHQVAFEVDGLERVRWHFGPQYPRPFFYPLVGPASGRSLTRMGHPGDPSHDHHRSVWFAHDKVSGVNFWGDTGPARVRQKQWLAYTDGDAEAVMAVRLGWADGHDPKDLLEQDLFAAVVPGPGDGEALLELQATFRPTAATLELGQSNFGVLGVRVSKALSAFFGGGTITNAAGATGEPATFGHPAAWVDYSGEQAGKPEGVTVFDHPANPAHPARWHTREDGWVGPSLCRTAPVTLTRANPLTLRYLLHAHRGPVDADRANAVFAAFGKRPAFELVKAPAKHTAFAARRTG